MMTIMGHGDSDESSRKNLWSQASKRISQLNRRVYSNIRSKLNKISIGSRRSSDKKKKQPKSPTQDRSPMAFNRVPLYKVILIGSGNVGKSALTLQFMYDEFVEDYEPTKADSYRRRLTLDGHDVQIDILDTAGQDDNQIIRDTYYESADGFLCIFSITDQDSYVAIGELVEQVLHSKHKDASQSGVQMIIVGNKTDLNSSRTVSSEKAQELARHWNLNYIETSAKAKQNVEEIFFSLIRLIISVNTAPDIASSPSVSSTSRHKQKTTRKAAKKNRHKCFAFCRV